MNSDLKKIRIGVLGTASIAIKSIIPAIQRLDDRYTLAGIAGRTLPKTELVCKNFNIKPFLEYDSILTKDLIDVIYIPLPNALHFEWVKKSLKSGLHVLVEKSLGCNLREVAELNNLARKNNLVLIENFQFRFHSQLEKIREILDGGRIGDLRSLRSSFGFPPFQDRENIRYKSELGGGALLDAGAYPVKISQCFLGEELEIKASNLFYDPHKKVDIWGGAYLSQKNGHLFSQIAFGFDNSYQCSIELWGSKGRLYTNRIFTAPPGHEPEIIIETPAGREISTLSADDHFEKMLIHLYSLIISMDTNLINKEYKQNINQARLLEELKLKANEQ